MYSFRLNLDQSLAQTTHSSWRCCLDWLLAALGRSGVLLWVEEHDVHLRHEQTAQGHRRAQHHAHAQTWDLDLKKKVLEFTSQMFAVIAKNREHFLTFLSVLQIWLYKKRIDIIVFFVLLSKRLLKDREYFVFFLPYLLPSPVVYTYN